LGGHAAFITVALMLITGIAHAAPLAYLTMGGNLWVVDTATNTVRAVVPGADGPGVGISPSGARVYVTNETDASVSVFDATANRLLAKVPLSATGAERHARAGVASRTPTPSSPGGTATATVIPPKAIGSEPVGVVVDPSGDKVFIAAVGAALVLDTASNEIVESIPLPLENGRELLSEGIAVSPDGTRLYVVTHSVLNVGPYGVNLLVVIDPQAGETIATIPLSGTPVGVVVHPDGRSIFVSTNLYMSPFESHGAVLIIDAATGTVVDTVISPGGIIGAIALSADGSRLYASGDFFAMDISTRALVLRGPHTGTFDISVTPDGKMAYLPRFNTVPFRMAVVDTATGAVRTTVQLGCNARAFGLFIGPSSGPPVSPTPTPGASYPFVYVVNSYSDSVTASYVGSGALFDGIEVGFEPQGMAVRRDGRQAVVTNWGGHSISLIDTVRRVAVAAIQVGERPFDVVVAPDGSTAYVALLSRPGGVDVVDLDARRVRTTLPLGPTARLAISPDGRRLYVANGDVSVIDTASDATLATLPTVAAGALSVSPDGATLYASTSSSVLAIDIASMQPATMLPMGGIDIGVTTDGQRLLVSIDRSEGVTQRGGVMLIDTATGTLLTEIPTASVPDRIAISPDGQLAYVVMINGTAAIIDLTQIETVGLLPTGCSARGIAIAPVSIQPMPARCAGDCDADGVVTVDELARAVGVALGKTFLDACTALDANVDRSPDVSELVSAVGNALNGCAVEPPPTPTLTPSRAGASAG
jgi:YVTN family beta-propeller protein